MKVEEGYLVTGILVPLIVPVDTPLWMLAIAVAFGVVIGKEVFGGTGMNILNPALTIALSCFLPTLLGCREIRYGYIKLLNALELQMLFLERLFWVI